MLDVYVIDSAALMVGRLRDVLDANEATRIVEFIEIKEEETESGFDRFCDLTTLKGIQLSSDDVQQLALRRRAFNPNNIRVKSAFLANDPLAAGIARMYQQLLDSPRIEVRVFNQLNAAAEWLAVNPERLLL
jgi:hypothetical protein